MRRRRRIAVAVGGVCLVAVGATALVLRPLSDSTSAARPAAAQRSSALAALDLLADHPERLVPASLSKMIDPRTAVPLGTAVHPDASTWLSTGPRSGTVQVVLTGPDGSRARYLAVMVEQAGSWRVLETAPL